MCKRHWCSWKANIALLFKFMNNIALQHDSISVKFKKKFEMLENSKSRGKRINMVCTLKISLNSFKDLTVPWLFIDLEEIFSLTISWSGSHVFSVEINFKELYRKTKRSSKKLYKYTAISRKVVRRNVHATIPKGNMGSDQYTVPDTVAVETAFVAFF